MTLDLTETGSLSVIRVPGLLARPTTALFLGWNVNSHWDRLDVMDWKPFNMESMASEYRQINFSNCDTLYLICWAVFSIPLLVLNLRGTAYNREFDCFRWLDWNELDRYDWYPVKLLIWYGKHWKTTEADGRLSGSGGSRMQDIGGTRGETTSRGGGDLSVMLGKRRR